LPKKHLEIGNTVNGFQNQNAKLSIEKAAKENEYIDF
jgi:hypothetical protein